MKSSESAALPEDVKLATLKEAKGGSWYDNWKPYCVREACPSGLQRMEKHPYGFECKTCGNKIGWDLTRLDDSPLNRVGSSKLGSG
jgi:hypothetical protein